ncbi:MAG: hypothetical protein KGI98_15565 [Euryarchaeota archaeon]|nr:hypothetical protein [Euryarchaeota archaeon]
MTGALTSKYNPHTRAVKMAAQSVKDVVGTFAKDSQDAPFMGVKRSPGRQAVHERITSSPTAMEMIRRGYSMEIADQVAKAEQEVKG